MVMRSHLWYSPMPGAEKVPVIRIITDLPTEQGKPLCSIMLTFLSVFICMFLVKDGKQQAHRFSVVAVVAVEAEESTTPTEDFFRQRFIFTIKDRFHEGVGVHHELARSVVAQF